MSVTRIIDAIKDAENIAILPHVSADGDALGSVWLWHWHWTRLVRTAKFTLKRK